MEKNYPFLKKYTKSSSSEKAWSLLEYKLQLSLG